MFNIIKEKFSSILKKINSGFFYIVDRETLYKYLNEQIEFANNNNLEMVEELNIYYGDRKYNLSLWDFAKSSDKNEQEKGFSVLFNNHEYHTIINLFENGIIEEGIYFKKIDYFKIELIYGDSVNLSEYKREHPELTEDFWKKYISNSK